MIKFYFHPTPNPMKVALFLAEAELPFEVIPVDTMKGEQHEQAFRAINPNGKLPAIDDDGTVVFDSNAILLYLADKHGLFAGRPEDRGALLSWLMFIASGLGPYSGQAVHFQRAAPETVDYAINRYRREAERHYAILDARLADRTYFLGDDYTIVDIAAWGWIDRHTPVLGPDALEAYPNLKRWFDHINARPAVAKARDIGTDITFKSERDEVAMRALFPQNYAEELVEAKAS
ncbi:glutathione S-transferase, N-terminal domain protein [Rhodobacteraceae bacterium KLH11]|nr:glutathione S-transferase, N-terminal domain protein [Rhodobacteraceae bacterium KLH11]